MIAKALWIILFLSILSGLFSGLFLSVAENEGVEKKYRDWLATALGASVLLFVGTVAIGGVYWIWSV